MSYFHDIENVAHLPLPWEKLSGCNILITGATGLIGTCLTQVLMARSGKDYHVYATGRDEARAKERFAKFLSDPSFHFIPYDVTMPLEASGVPFHYIIHAASNASPNFFANHPVEVIKSNILGVSHLMEYGISHQMRRLLYVSTGEVYGEGDGHEFTENFSGYVDCTSSRSCYPSSKRAAETLCVSYAAEYGADVVIARPCHTYGPHFTEKDNRVYAQFIRNVLQGQDIIMKSTGEQFRSWCYVVDCVSALLYILLRGINGQAYNIADNSSNISIRNLAEMIAGIGGKEVVMQLPSDDEKKGYNVVTRSVFSTQKLESLGWSVQGSMIEKMERTVEECKNRK
ncbi:MAG: NAD-dependent epimerase/dehydratase family protein [Bacteroidaceae bacterium]|nr:NAD-dependent epimerase/dehydratase family protein [Bacteroidaceae bacterium]